MVSHVVARVLLSGSYGVFGLLLQRQFQHSKNID